MIYDNVLTSLPLAHFFIAKILTHNHLDLDHLASFDPDYYKLVVNLIDLLIDLLQPCLTPTSPSPDYHLTTTSLVLILETWLIYAFKKLTSRVCAFTLLWITAESELMRLHQTYSSWDTRTLSPLMLFTPSPPLAHRIEERR